MQSESWQIGELWDFSCGSLVVAESLDGSSWSCIQSTQDRDFPSCISLYQQLTVTIHLAVALDSHKTYTTCDEQHSFTRPRPLEPTFDRNTHPPNTHSRSHSTRIQATPGWSASSSSSHPVQQSPSQPACRASKASP
jgi:hypothetical protein